MGIDCYMYWKDMKPEDHDKQITGFSTIAGEVGYLREAYHGGPYVTRFLVQESFDESVYDALSEEEKEVYKGSQIPAATLRKRLPPAVFLSLARHAVVYDEPWHPNDGKLRREFDLPEDATIDDGAGVERVITTNPEVRAALTEVFEDIAKMKNGELEFGLVSNLTDEQVRAIDHLIATRNLPDYALTFVDFVRLAELKEAETGQPVRVYASY